MTPLGPVVLLVTLAVLAGVIVVCAGVVRWAVRQLTSR